MLEIHVDAGPRKVTEAKNIVLLQLLCNDPCKDRFVIGNEVTGALLLAESFHSRLLLELIQNLN